MQKLTATKVRNAEHLLGKRPEGGDSSIFVDKDTAVFDEHGEIMIVYVVLPENDVIERMRRAVRRINYQKTERVSGIPTNDAVFGYKPPNSYRRTYCSATKMANVQKKEHDALVEAGKYITSRYQELLPEEYRFHEGLSKSKVSGEWLIEGTPFTSGVVNKNNELPYHQDRGNFENVYSNMVAFKKNVAGGLLNCPEYDLQFEIADRSLLMFDGQKIIHGVTPIDYEGFQSYRYSVVYYSLEQMWRCETLSEELDRANRQKNKRIYAQLEGRESPSEKRIKNKQRAKRDNS